LSPRANQPQRFTNLRIKNPRARHVKEEEEKETVVVVVVVRTGRGFRRYLSQKNNVE
jgi:hypothetical protein